MKYLRICSLMFLIEGRVMLLQPCQGILFSKKRLQIRFLILLWEEGTHSLFGFATLQRLKDTDPLSEAFACFSSSPSPSWIVIIRSVSSGPTFFVPDSVLSLHP